MGIITQRLISSLTATGKIQYVRDQKLRGFGIKVTAIDLHVISSCLNHAPVGVTMRSYLGGGLAKRSMLAEAYKMLQRQYGAYVIGLPEEKYPSDTNLTDLAHERGAERY